MVAKFLTANTIIEMIMDISARDKITIDVINADVFMYYYTPIT